MNKKIESLQKLRELVAKDETILADGSYYSSIRNCNCVIGLLVKQAGVTDEQLSTLDDPNKIKSPYTVYSIYGILEDIKAGDVEKEKDIIGNALLDLGFDPHSEDDGRMLRVLQNSNDTDGKSGVIEELDYFISTLLDKEQKEVEGNE